MKKRLSVAMRITRDTAATGAPRDVAKIDVKRRNLIKPATS